MCAKIQVPIGLSPQLPTWVLVQPCSVGMTVSEHWVGWGVLPPRCPNPRAPGSGRDSPSPHSRQIQRLAFFHVRGATQRWIGPKASTQNK